MIKYTVTRNYGEGAEGLFETREQANKYRASQIRKDNPDIPKNLPLLDVIDYDAEGYYEVLEISI